ncbi:MAG: hypothetical protein A2169_13165 [Deltaproteobacteria bacterium RBG_13_47_9]|nr:MAG: hypothetical protein A2169_13165 [Deltaproteobacteria bacterium RBG_13_47_9]
MEQELILRKKLAAACHVLAKEGHADNVLGHLSIRIEPDAFLMKPRGFGLEEVSAEDMIIINLEGQKVSGKHAPHNEIPIHTEIFRVRPDVQCVVHTHPLHSIAFSATGEDLKPLSNDGCIFWPGVPRFIQMTDLIYTKEQGKLLAECLGDRRAVLMVGHGITVVGGSVEEATVSAIYLEKTAQIQLMVMHREDYSYTPDEEASLKQKRIFVQTKIIEKWKYYLRKWGEKEVEGLE